MCIDNVVVSRKEMKQLASEMEEEKRIRISLQVETRTHTYSHTHTNSHSLPHTHRCDLVSAVCFVVSGGGRAH